jgi:hypothetical protein
VAVIRAPSPPRRTISERIALLPEDSTAVMDADFAKDVEAAIESHRERRGQNARQMLAAIARTAGNIDIAISVVTLIELAHGAARTDTAARKAKRQQFIQGYYTHGTTHSSGHEYRCSSRRSDRRREPGERHTPFARRSVDRRHGLRTRISPRSGEEFLFLTSPLIGSLTGGGNRFHSTAIPQLSKKRPGAATVENRSSHPM